MIAVLAIALGLVLSFLSGGRIKNLASLRLRHAGWILGLFAVQSVVRGWNPNNSAFRNLPIVLWGLVGLILLMLLALESERLLSVLVGLGLWLNLLVVLVNQGMPVHYPIGSTSGGFYHAMDQGDSLLVLADVLPAPGGYLLSLGDMLLTVGISALIARQSHIVVESD